MKHPVLPCFKEICYDQLVAELEALLDKSRVQLQQLLSQDGFTWDNLMAPVEMMEDQLSRFWSPISHLHGVLDSAPLRAAYTACLPLLSQYSTEVGQNKAFFQAVEALSQSPEAANYSVQQKKIIDNYLRDFRLAGVALPAEKKQRYSEISEQLALLQNKFEQNVLDATEAWCHHVTDLDILQGLPAMMVEMAAQQASDKGLEGWIFTLDMPSYLPVMKYADNRSFRQEMYYAYITRASDCGPLAGQFDNTQVINDILILRQELAQLLGFAHFSERSLATKMVDKPEAVLDFLQNLLEVSQAAGKKEFVELEQFALESLDMKPVQAWDVGYVSEKLREARYSISDEEVKEFFPLPRVVDGLLGIVERLYGVEINPVEVFDRYHADVDCFEITNPKGDVLSYFYLDLYARKHKRGGAWMDDYQARRRLENGDIQLPVAFINCNFTRPIGDAPALLTHYDVVTLFHETGHALQHMLTEMDYADISGINGVPWDAVEIASQFFENWAWSREALNYVSEHYQRGDPFPKVLFDKLCSSRNFQSALHMLRQIEFALFDFRLHMEFTGEQEKQVQAIIDEVRRDVVVVPVADFNRFQHGFSHIFSGGYAAGYYSYKWAEVMAVDAFSLFEEEGVFNSEIAQRFRDTFLKWGGARDPMELFIEFRGRKPKVEPLLKQAGIIQAVCAHE